MFVLTKSIIINVLILIISCTYDIRKQLIGILNCVGMCIDKV